MKIGHRHGKHIFVDGRRLTIFCSNDYLGLSVHKDVVAAAKRAASRAGIGSGGAPGTSGRYEDLRLLEKEIAAFKRKKAAIVFSSGYAANLGLFSFLARQGAIFFVDELVHPSIIDGIRLANGRLVRFRHNDAEDLERKLHIQRGRAGRHIVFDSVYPVGGDVAPLADFHALADRHDCGLIADEAHATGVLGKRGRGIEEHFRIADAVRIASGTLSKALGSQGGFVAGDSGFISELSESCRTWTYSTTLSPVSCAAARAALRLARSDRSLLEGFSTTSRLLKTGIEDALGLPADWFASGCGYIFRLDCRSRSDARKVAGSLRKAGVFVAPLGEGSTPHPGGHLRITPMVLHTEKDIDRLVDALSSVSRLFVRTVE